VARAADDAPGLQPPVVRRQVKVPRIDTEDFEIGGFGGVLTIEDFGSSGVAGVRAAYHLTEDLFFEGTYARSTISDTSFRRFGARIFPSEDEDLSYYNLSIGYNLLPGEVFIGRRAMTSAFYLIAGAGNTHFVDEDHLTFNVGFGLRLLATDWLSLRIDVRDHIFESDILGESKYTNNVALTGGLGVFF